MISRRQQILDLWKQGLTAQQIADRLGYKSRGMVANVILAARDAGEVSADERVATGRAANRRRP